MVAEIYKILVVGPPGAGKSSLIRAYLHGEFIESYVATVGVDMKATPIETPTGNAALTIVDLGGQESFTLLRSRFYQGAHFIMFVYDITDRNSFKNISEWYATLSSSVCRPQRDTLAGMLVGNKIDLTSKRQVSTDEGINAAKIFSLSFFEASAKTGENVGEIFLHAVNVAHQKLHVK